VVYAVRRSRQRDKVKRLFTCFVTAFTSFEPIALSRSTAGFLRNEAAVHTTAIKSPEKLRFVRGVRGLVGLPRRPFQS